MNRDPGELKQLQLRFAAALRAPAAAEVLADEVLGDGFDPGARLRLYRNNSAAALEGALTRTYPVLRKRVGADYFTQLAREYRRQHPSRAGDLHHVGRDYPAWVAARHAGSELAWLGDLAQLEWACEEALVAEHRAPAALAILATVPGDQLGGLRLQLQSSVRLLASDYPVWSIWRANQSDAAAAPVDPEVGAEWVVLHCADAGLLLRKLPPAEWQFVAMLRAGGTLGAAFERAELDAEALQRLLAWLFDDGLVVAIATDTD
jgi:hypothetical protein